MKLSVYLIEDDIDFARSLLKVLQSNQSLDVVGHATTLGEARDFLQTQSADVFLVDISLPDGNGIDLMREIRSQYAQPKIMVLSTLGHEKHIVSSLQAGASGYLLKSEMPAQIIQSIISVANDGGALGQHASKVLIDKLVNPSATARPLTVPMPLITAEELNMLQTINDGPKHTKHISLTSRELEILKVVQKGLATKNVADIFGISVFTVNQHLRNIFSKLGTRNKMEAVQEASQLGLL
jgi:DNA-binding NarL/FixJ family response regulator